MHCRPASVANCSNRSAVISTARPCDGWTQSGLSRPTARSWTGGYSGQSFTVNRYTTSGVLDTSFGSGGSATVKVLNGTGTATLAGIALDSSGRIVLAGWGPASNQNNFVLTRLTSSGGLDRTFGKNGVVLTQVPSVSGAGAPILQPDGKILL